MTINLEIISSSPTSKNPASFVTSRLVYIFKKLRRVGTCIWADTSERNSARCLWPGSGSRDGAEGSEGERRAERASGSSYGGGFEVMNFGHAKTKSSSNADSPSSLKVN
jgi:hypothetical protein